MTFFRLCPIITIQNTRVWRLASWSEDTAFSKTVCKYILFYVSRLYGNVSLAKLKGLWRICLLQWNAITLQTLFDSFVWFPSVTRLPTFLVWATSCLIKNDRLSSWINSATCGGLHGTFNIIQTRFMNTLIQAVTVH